jgi:hypothetical protein
MKTETDEAGVPLNRKNPQSHAVFFDSAAVVRSHRGAAGALARAEA